jgi:hypothetical protein
MCYLVRGVYITLERSGTGVAVTFQNKMDAAELFETLDSYE